jgi:hypothetical protein
MKTIYYTTLVLILCSCQNEKDGHQKPSILSHFIKTTQFEKSGVDEVLDYYGGNCYYSKGVEYSTGKPNAKYFDLEISSSDILNKQIDNFFIVSSNVAYLFYKNIRNSDHDYQQIHVSIKSNDVLVEEASFEVKDLEIVHKNQSKLLGYVDLFANKKYDEILDRIDSTTNFSSEVDGNVKKVLIETDSIFGEIDITNPFLLAGFHFQPENNEIVRYYGVLVRTIKNCEFSIDFSSSSKDSLIKSFAYKY